MNYTKPEVEVLGAAVSVIAGPKPTGHQLDNGVYDILPAYDLDE